jgi:prophage tail gpP-like protein
VNRPADTIRIASTNGSSGVVVDRITKFEISNSFTEPAAALFELGDDRTWRELADVIAIGNRFAVVVNGYCRLTGRMIARRLPVSADAGASVQLTVRTKLADAVFASANPAIRLDKASLQDVVYQAYQTIGLGPEDFYTEADLAVDLMTGKGGSGRKVDLDELKEDAAKVKPPETIYAFVERHLNRFHLSHWDAPDGRIVIGAPSNEQSPIYRLRLRREDPQRNNVTSAEKVEDYEQTPSVLLVSGQSGGGGFARAKVRGSEINAVLVGVDPVINRPVFIVDDAIKTQEQADARARRELLMRSRQTDAWTMEVDGLAHWDGEQLIPWGIDTIADVDVDVAGARACGAYLINRVTMRGDADAGYTTALEMCRKGLWVL